MSMAFLSGLFVKAGRLRLNEQVSVSRWGNRAISFIQNGDKYWTVLVETQTLYDDQLAKLEAWLARARGGMETIVFTPRGNEAYPQNYWSDRTNAAIMNDGNLVLVTSGKQLSINSVTTGLVITEGDLVSLATGDYRSLHRVTVGATSAASAITISVEPPVPSYITNGAICKFANQEINMRLLPSTVEVADGVMPTARFQLIEVPR